MSLDVCLGGEEFGSRDRYDTFFTFSRLGPVAETQEKGLEGL